VDLTLSAIAHYLLKQSCPLNWLDQN